MADFGVAPAGRQAACTDPAVLAGNYADTASPNDQAGWGQMLPEIFDDRVKVTNRARGGRTARWFYLEGEAQWIPDRIQPGDHFFIQFGTNDSHPTAAFTVDGVTYGRYAEAGTDLASLLGEAIDEQTVGLQGSLLP